MISIPAKAKDRLSKGTKKFCKILLAAKDNGINEADTVTIVKDILAEVFGYDKYSEITSEYAVKNTFCDLAIKRDDRPYILIEVKAIGLDLKDAHTRQALNYGQGIGTEWIVLTNGLAWKVYKIVFGQPVETELIYEFSFDTINLRKDSDVEMLFLLCKESVPKQKSRGLLDDYVEQKQLASRYMIGQMLISDETLNLLRRKLKQVSNTVKISNDDIKNVLVNEIIKREVFDDERSIEAKKRIAKAERSAQNKRNIEDKPKEQT